MSKRRNTFSRALRQLKSEEIDKKIQLTETLPTNNTMGVFISMPPGAVVSTTTVSRETWGEADLDFDVDGESDGTDTTGLFETDGTPKAAMPPGDTSYILGPMSAMYYSWWSGGTTTIGYIRQADRKMVNLGTVSGKLHEWDGASFSSYGQLTLEQAQWFKDVKKKDNAGNNPNAANYRAFYPGPPSNTPDANGRYLCTITGAPKDKTVTQNVEVPHSPTEKGTWNPGDAFSGILDRLFKSADLRRNLAKRGIDAGEWWNSQFEGNQIAATGAKLTWGIMDNILYGNSNYLLKGVSKGYNFSPNFYGAGPKNSSILNALPKYKGQKLVDWADDILSTKNFKPNFVKNIVGKNYYGQWFTDPTMVDVATGYAKDGTISLVPRTQGKWGWKNWFSSNTSRSLAGQPETFQRADDLVNALKGGKGRLDLPVDNARTQKLLRRYATKVATNSKTLKVFARGIPILGASISAVDAISRFSRGDWQGGALSILSMTPGPAGWAALGAQVAVDTGAVEKGVEFMYNRQTGFNPETGMFEPKTMKGSRSRFREAVEDQNNKIGNMNLEEAKQQMIKMGVPLDNPEELANEMGLMMLGAGMNPEIVEIAQLAIVGAKLTKKQQKDIEEKMMKMSAVLVAGERAKETKPQNAQESRVLSEDKASRVLKNLKKPVVLPEGKKKTYKVKPGARMRGMDKLIGDIKPQESYKEPQKIWSKNSQGYNARSSQEKKNQVLQYVGASMDHWDYMTDTVKKQGGKIMANYKDHDYLYDYWLGGTRKKAVRKEEVKGDYVVFLDDGTSMLQSSYNEKVEQEKEKEMFDEYYKLNPKNEPIPYENDPLFKRVTKRLKPVIDYPDKPAKKGYPNEPPPKMVNGWHPEYGKRYKYDKLDPVSAKAMPPTGNPEIDANVEKTKVKPK